MNLRIGILIADIGQRNKGNVRSFKRSLVPVLRARVFVPVQASVPLAQVFVPAQESVPQVQVFVPAWEPVRRALE